MGIHRMLSRRMFQIRYTNLQLQRRTAACIERNNATDGQIFVFDSKYSTGSVDFPTVTLTYTIGDNGGDNGNSNTNNQTTAKPTTTSPKTGDATATLPVAGTGLALLGVALATVLRKRK